VAAPVSIIEWFLNFYDEARNSKVCWDLAAGAVVLVRDKHCAAAAVHGDSDSDSITSYRQLTGVTHLHYAFNPCSLPYLPTLL
jgi:hypothetical protein